MIKKQQIFIKKIRSPQFLFTRTKYCQNNYSESSITKFKGKFLITSKNLYNIGYNECRNIVVQSAPQPFAPISRQGAYLNSNFIICLA